jgi:hypothetical protein
MSTSAGAESAVAARKPVWWWAAWVLLGVLIGAQALRMRMAEGAVEAGNGIQAVAARPQNGWGHALVAQGLLAGRNGKAALVESRRALALTPLSVGAVRTLAKSLEATAGGASGERAWQVASSMGWRDRQTQLWALIRALTNGEADVFVMRADALMRTRSEDPEMAAVIRQALTEPAIRQTFVKRLAIEPEWRTRLFSAGRPLVARELEGTLAALRDLGRTPNRPTRSELRDTILGLIAAGRYGEAVALDRQFVKRTRDRGSLIGDGGFDLPNTTYRNDTTPFDWMINGNGATLDQSGGERSMVIDTAANANRALERYVVLAPGAYRLSYAIQGPAEAGTSVAIRVFCGASRKPIAASAPRALESGGWNQRSFSFNVAPGCQLTRIVFGEVAGSESVEALIDNIRLAPAGAAQGVRASSSNN